MSYAPRGGSRGRARSNRDLSDQGSNSAVCSSRPVSRRRSGRSRLSRRFAVPLTNLLLLYCILHNQGILVPQQHCYPYARSRSELQYKYHLIGNDGPAARSLRPTEAHLTVLHHRQNLSLHWIFHRDGQDRYGYYKGCISGSRDRDGERTTGKVRSPLVSDA